MARDKHAHAGNEIANLVYASPYVQAAASPWGAPAAAVCGGTFVMNNSHGVLLGLEVSRNGLHGVIIGFGGK